MQSSTRTWQIKNVLCILILCTKSTSLITKINQIEPMKGAYIELHCTAFSKSLESLRVEKQREKIQLLELQTRKKTKLWTIFS